MKIILKPFALSLSKGCTSTPRRRKEKAGLRQPGGKHGAERYGECVASQEIEILSQALARLPGLGPRSARRAVLHLMKRRQTALEPLLAALQTVAERLST